MNEWNKRLIVGFAMVACVTVGFALAKKAHESGPPERIIERVVDCPPCQGVGDHDMRLESLESRVKYIEKWGWGGGHFGGKRK